jgi:hypothetical protein
MLLPGKNLVTDTCSSYAAVQLYWSHWLACMRVKTAFRMQRLQLEWSYHILPC